MPKIESKVTVFFEGQFWVGVYERLTEGKLEVCKITFGAEPKDYEVYQFLLKNWQSLRFSRPITAENNQKGRANPKRMQREIKRNMENPGVGTKAQQALKLQFALGKEARQKRSRLEKLQEAEKKFAMRQEKKKQKRKGH